MPRTFDERYRAPLSMRDPESLRPRRHPDHAAGQRSVRIHDAVVLRQLPAACGKRLSSSTCSARGWLRTSSRDRETSSSPPYDACAFAHARARVGQMQLVALALLWWPSRHSRLT